MIYPYKTSNGVQYEFDFPMGTAPMKVETDDGTAYRDFSQYNTVIPDYMKATGNEIMHYDRSDWRSKSNF